MRKLGQSTSPVDESAARILIVDDTPANLALLVDALQTAGYRPLVANSGEAALGRLEQTRPDLVLLDMRMPGLDGMATMARIKAHPQWREMPVIFMTAVEEPEQKVAAFAAGAVDYVTKPFEASEVLARIGTHLRMKALQNDLAVELGWRAETERTLQAFLEQAVLVAARDGRIQFCTDRARRLLERYYAREGDVLAGNLPPPLAAVVKMGRSTSVLVTCDRAELEIRVVADPTSDAPVTFLFEERRPPGDYSSLRTLGLTEREAEVLYWISQGKSNPEISVIIGAASGTVRKHAENIFGKLAVEGRSGAMLMALEVLQRR